MVPDKPFVYVCNKLHNIKYGDAATKDRMKVSMKEVDICDSKEEAAVGPLEVYFNHSGLVQGLEQDLPNIALFHQSLFHFLFDKYTAKRKGERDSGGFRDHFGINQIQNAKIDPKPKYYTDEGDHPHHLPHCCLVNNYNGSNRIKIHYCLSTSCLSNIDIDFFHSAKGFTRRWLRHLQVLREINVNS